VLRSVNDQLSLWDDPAAGAVGVARGVGPADDHGQRSGGRTIREPLVP
jgi:hypothetical protein